MENLKLSLLFKEYLLFFPVLLLGILIGTKYYSAVEIQKMTTGFSIGWFLVSFAIAVGLVLLFLKFIRYRLPYQILMSLMIFIGSINVFNAFLNLLYSTTAAAALIVIYWTVRRILIHNAVIIITISGVAAYLGLLLNVRAITVLLLVVSIYDIIAVFKTKHMIRMFKQMASQGVFLSLIIPHKIKSVGQKIAKIDLSKRADERDVVIIGTGDAAFPAVLAIAALPYGLTPALFVSFGALLGLTVVHFVMIKTKEPLPALPPISAGATLGLLVGLLV